MNAPPQEGSSDHSRFLARSLGGRGRGAIPLLGLAGEHTEARPGNGSPWPLRVTGVLGGLGSPRPSTEIHPLI